MDRIQLNGTQEVPLFLLPQVIGKHIRKTGDRIYRISVKRTHWHYYNVTIRTRSLPRELMPGRTAVCEPEVRPVPERHGTAGGGA